MTIAKTPDKPTSLATGCSLAECESIIREHTAIGQQSALEISRALARIKAEKLYVENGYKDFQTYCHEVFGYGTSRVYQILEFSKVVDEIKESLPEGISTKVEMPAIETTARALLRIPKGSKGEVWLKVLEQVPHGQNITARHVSQVAEQWQKNKAIAQAEHSREEKQSQTLINSLEEAGALDKDAAISITAVEIADQAKENPNMLVSNIEQAEGLGWHDLVIIELDTVCTTMAKLLTAIDPLVKPGARFVLFCRPGCDYSFVKAAEKEGWVREHTIVGKFEYSDIKNNAAFWHNHIVGLVFSRSADHAKLFEELVNLPSLLDRPIDSVLQTYAAEGDRVLCVGLGIWHPNIKD